jgi:hypothetical protein
VQSPNPSIVGSGIMCGLGVDQEAAANKHDLSVKQAALDRADLREVERAEYYGETSVVTEPVVAPRRRSLLDRLFRR